MRYGIRRSDPTVWRAGASEAELARIAEIDAALLELEAKRAALSNERRILTNRACQRGRWARRSNKVGPA